MGVPVDRQKFYSDPLGAVVSNVITLGAAEMEAARQRLNIAEPWDYMATRERRLVATEALLARGDAQSRSQAEQIMLGNPNFGSFRIVS